MLARYVIGMDGVSPPWDRAVFHCDAETWTWRDVRDAARFWGEWEGVQDAAARAIALGWWDGSDEGMVPVGDVAPAERAFRTRLGLHAAEDTIVWVQHWGFTVEALRTQLRINLSDTGERRAGAVGDIDLLDKAAWVAVVCSGESARIARLAARRAAAASNGEGDPGRLVEAERSLRRAAATDQAISALVARRVFDWTSIKVTAATTQSEGAAAELLSCVCDDGLVLEDVAVEAGAVVGESMTRALRICPRSTDACSQQPLPASCSGRSTRGTAPGRSCS